MHGSRPDLFQLRQLILAAVVITGLTAIIAGVTLCSLDGFSQSAATIISITRMDIGSAPTDFQFARTGQGGVGQWKVVTDESSFSGLVIEQASVDRTAAVLVGSYCPGHHVIGSSSINGHRTTAIRSQVARRFLRSTCTSTPITSTSVQKQRLMLTPSWLPSAGKIPISCSAKFLRGVECNRATSPDRRFVMRALLSVLFVSAIVSGSAMGQEIDWQKVDAAFGRKPVISGDVHRYGFPRNDLSVTLDGVA